MAAVPGKNCSSVGGGNQPPNKRSKMETGQSSNPALDQDSLYSDQPGSVRSVMRVDTENLKCPVCREYPRMEVYQCNAGHIVCQSCIKKRTRCPVCRAKYAQKKIRNRVAENLLEGMAFDCSFKNEGCLEECIPRNRRTSHEIQCEHNPSPPGFKLCGLLEHARHCQLRVDPNFILQDPQHTKDVIEHLERFHSLPYKKIKIGEKSLLRSRLPYPFDLPIKPFVVFELIDGTTGNTIGYYVVIRRILMPARTNLSWAVIGLNSAPVDLSGGNRHSDKIPITFSIKAKTNPNKVARDGAGCVPNQSWTIKSMYLNEWEELMTDSVKDNQSISFSLSRNFLSEYYRQEDGKYELSVSFGPLGD